MHASEEKLALINLLQLYISHCKAYARLIATERLLQSSLNMPINADRGIALNAPGFLGRPCGVDRSGFPDSQRSLILWKIH